MGLAASQARLLMLTARKSDIEFRGQTLNNRRLSLTYKMEELANTYADGLSNRRLQMSIDNGQTLQDFDSSLLSGLGFTLADSSGIGFATNANGQYIDESGQVMTDEQIEQKLRLGTMHIVDKTDLANGKYNLTFDWRSDTTATFKDDYDDTDDEAVSARYEAESIKIQGEDKRLEMELKQLDTEHKAVETELDAVKKVIDKNIQQSFKTFG